MRNTFGEALVALTGLAGFIVLAYRGTITLDEIWAYAAALGITVVFYFLLLLARAIHIFMVGDHAMWWEKYAEDDRKKSGRWSKK
jgi:hypothetical protein